MRYFSTLFTSISLILSCFLVGCGSKLPAVKSYKMDIQQGNVVTSKMLLQLRPGMTKSQVRFIMGTPLIMDSFHGNRWDYFYQLRQQGKVIEKRRVILDFEKDLLVSVRGDVVPASDKTAEAAVDTSAKSVTPAKKPVEKPWFDMFKFWGDDEPIAQPETKEPAKAASDAPVAAATAAMATSAPTPSPIGAEAAVAAAAANIASDGAAAEPESILKIKPDVANAERVNLLPQAPAAETAAVVDATQSSSTQSSAEVESVQPAAVDSNVAESPAVDRAAEPAPAAVAPIANAQEAASMNQAIQAALEAWAQAWRNKNLAAYLGAYAKDFKPENNLSKSAWMAQRKQRLSGKRGDISLVLEDIEISANGNQASVQFFQKYASKVYTDEVTKQLDLSFDATTQRWLIVREFVVANGRRVASQKVLAPEESSEHLDGVIEKIGF